MSVLWEVAVPVPLRRVFTYSLGEERGPGVPGARVLVPFGRRRLTGYLLNPLEGPAPTEYQVRRVIDLLDTAPAIPEELLLFLRQAADYYMHPIGEVLKAALPPGMDPSERKGALKGPRVKARTVRVFSTTEEGRAALEGMERRAPVRARVLAAVIDAGEIDSAGLKAATGDAAAHARRLVADGHLSEERRGRLTDPFTGPVSADVPPELTEEQQVAVDELVRAVEEGEYRGFLLKGITGSGKTEVYLRAVAAAREKGLGALVLVPEITLTPQLVRRYRARFGDSLAVLHSGLTDRERFDQWTRLRSGDVRVAVGVRSAVFAPVENLGIVVVDEEHDGSFKQERGFPYNARDMALLRASRRGAVAVLGSATPSMESFHNARAGKLSLLSLTSRPTKRPLPATEVIDLRRHRNGPGGQRAISGPLHRAISETLGRGEQTILFLNRRGFSPSLVCGACGGVIRCDSCAVSMTYHRRPSGLLCHYCGARRPAPSRCPECGAENLSPMGLGTQKVEEILEELFPEARVARLDRDTAAGRGSERVLDGLRTGETDILVGTQMVAKGHDFPGVTLVGVLLGDVGLHMPDFRAAERTFQLLTQVAGRAGRSELEGRALIQTYSPDHPSVDLARRHDFDGFARGEIAERRELGYPPFGRLAALRFSGPEEGRVEACAREVLAALRDAWARMGKPPVSMLGPVPAPLSLLQGRYRWRVLLRAERQDLIRRILGEIVGILEAPPHGVRLGVDVDPVSML